MRWRVAGAVACVTCTLCVVSSSAWTQTRELDSEQIRMQSPDVQSDEQSTIRQVLYSPPTKTAKPAARWMMDEALREARQGNIEKAIFLTKRAHALAISVEWDPDEYSPAEFLQMLMEFRQSQPSVEDPADAGESPSRGEAGSAKSGSPSPPEKLSNRSAVPIDFDRPQRRQISKKPSREVTLSITGSTLGFRSEVSGVSPSTRLRQFHSNSIDSSIGFQDSDRFSNFPNDRPDDKPDKSPIDDGSNSSDHRESKTWQPAVRVEERPTSIQPSTTDSHLIGKSQTPRVLDADHQLARTGSNSTVLQHPDANVRQPGLNVPTPFDASAPPVPAPPQADFEIGTGGINRRENRVLAVEAGNRQVDSVFSPRLFTTTFVQMLCIVVSAVFVVGILLVLALFVIVRRFGSPALRVEVVTNGGAGFVPAQGAVGAMLPAAYQAANPAAAVVDGPPVAPEPPAILSFDQKQRLEDEETRRRESAMLKQIIDQNVLLQKQIRSK